MLTILLRRLLSRRSLGAGVTRRCRKRFFRPLVEGLESRDLLAFNLTISSAATANVSTDDITVPGTRIFTATGSGAKLSLADMDTAFNAGLNVKVSSGSGFAIPLEAGSITTSGFTSHVFSNDPSKTLTIENGTGTNSNQADITATGLQMNSKGTLILDANQDVTLGGDIIAGVITVAAGTGSITMPSGGELTASTLSLTAGGTIGTNPSAPVTTNVSQLTTDTSANNTNQFITEVNGLTALNLNAGTGDTRLFVETGAVSDADAAIDITASSAFVAVADLITKDFGTAANPIGTSVSELTVNSQNGSGNQFITQAKALTDFQFNATNGSIVLNMTAGEIQDSDTLVDFIGSSATITLNDQNAADFGSSTRPIETAVNSLTMDTSAGGGDQFITETDGLTALDLDAGTGDVTLTVTAGAIADADSSRDISAAAAAVTLSDLTVKDVGATNDFLQTNVDSLSVNTSAGGGSQFVVNQGPLTALNLNAGAGAIKLVVALGAISDSDSSVDLSAASATVTLTDSAVIRNFGSAAKPIQTSVDQLSLTTVHGGDQFITEANGLTALDLNAIGLVLGDVSLTLTAGSISDLDAEDDIAADKVTIILSDGTAKNVGSAANPILTGLNSLAIDTAAGGGSQFITELNTLNAMDLKAGAGSVALVVGLGAVADTDASPDITAASASLILLDALAKNVGSTTSSIQTDVNTLSVTTAAGNGNQFIAEENSTNVTSLNAGTGNITLTGGTFSLAGPGAIGDSSTLVVKSPATVNLFFSSETMGGLAGSGSIAFPTSGPNAQLRVGSNNGDTTFSGSVTGVNTLATFQKEGTGTLTLSGTNSFAGQMIVADGRLLVNGTIDANFVLVEDGAILGGSDGTINQSVTLASGARLAPGDTTGVLNTGALAFAPGSTFNVEISNKSAGQFDQVNVTGSVEIDGGFGGVALNLTKFGTVTLNDNDELILIKNDGDGATGDAVDGTFKNLPEGANLGSNFLGTGHTAKISYVGGDGNDVSLKISPGSLFPWHNFTTNQANDVRGGPNNQPDGHIVADDVIAIINYINAKGSGSVPDNAIIGLPFGFLDTTQDNSVAADDVLAIINFINAHPGLGEAEASSMNGEPVFKAPEYEAAAFPSPELLLLLATDLASQPLARRRI